MKWQSRFVAYASAHNRTPEEQLEHDTHACAGAVMLGFILWTAERIAEFNNHHRPRCGGIPATKMHPEAFNRYVEYVAALWGMKQ